jgi:S1-C subfamily serine protease
MSAAPSTSVAAICIGLHLCGAVRDGRAEEPTEGRRAVERGVSAAARAIAPAVVRIEIGAGQQGGSALSGVVIDTQGHVVTNAAGVSSAQALSIVIEGGRWVPAHLRGSDPRSGVAVLVMDGAPPPQVQSARFGDSDLVEVGDWIVAIGRQSDATEAVSAGIISGRVHVTHPSPVSATVGAAAGALVTDVAIDAATSGGAIATLDGEVIALAGPERALPINQVRRVAQMLIADGETQYPYIGVLLTDVRDLETQERGRLGATPPPAGALVTRVVKGGPAAHAGLRLGDVITSVDNLETRVAAEVVDRVSYHAIGDRVMLGFVREGRERAVQVGVAALPPPSSRVSTNWVISAGAPSRMGGPQ